MLGVGKWRRSDNWCDGNVWFVSRNNVSDALYTLITTYSPPPTPDTSNGFLIIQFYICLHLFVNILWRQPVPFKAKHNCCEKREHWKPIIPASSFPLEQSDDVSHKYSRQTCVLVRGEGVHVTIFSHHYLTIVSEIYKNICLWHFESMTQYWMNTFPQTTLSCTEI